jgi:hypothetical protein
MYSANQLFAAAKLIAHAKGRRLPIGELDAFVTGGRQYSDDSIEINWYQQLVYTNGGRVWDAHRVSIILRKESWQQADHDPFADDTYGPGKGGILEENTVFDFTETQYGDADCFVLVPGPWQAQLVSLHDLVRSSPRYRQV